MRRRWLILALVGGMALAACAGTGDEAEDDMAMENESVTSEAPSETSTSGNNQSDDVSEIGDQPAGPNSTVDLTTSTTAAKTTPTTASAVPPPEGTVPPAVAGSDLVGKAKADLADRLGVNLDAIAVVSVHEVDWPDRSFGCPQPDMVYAQVITNGSRIILSVDGVAYYYHSAGAGDPFYCENPVDPVPGSEV